METSQIGSAQRFESNNDGPGDCDCDGDGDGDGVVMASYKFP